MQIPLLFIVSLFYEIYKGLCPHKLLEEGLVLSDILYIFVEIKDIIGRTSIVKVIYLATAV